MEVLPAYQVNVTAKIEQIYGELADEHRRIMTLVERLEHHDTVAHLVTLLEDLHELLINHFAQEQFPGGLYETLGGHGSAYHDELRVLVNEHCVILSSLRGVLERTRITSEDDAPEILREVSAVAKHLREHEHKEHELAEKVLRDAKATPRP
ncbi:MAG: hypothetical protein ACE5LB_02250 [Acidiferrobacterales bacterium]